MVLCVTFGIACANSKRCSVKKCLKCLLVPLRKMRMEHLYEMMGWPPTWAWWFLIDLAPLDSHYEFTTGTGWL